MSEAQDLDRIDQMSDEEISRLIPLLKKNQIQAAVIGLDDRSKLESVGKVINLEQLLELLDSTLQIEDKHHWKLSPLLVGTSHSLFGKMVLLATSQQMYIINHESMTEPVQHHITMISHEMNHQLNETGESVEKMFDEIETLNLQEVTLEDIANLKRRIDDYTATFRYLIEKTNALLTLAWNSKRLDLIESLNHIKNGCSKYLSLGIGEAKSKDSEATGLFAKIDQHFLGVYGKPGEIEALRDDEPAVEGLVKFSVWYLKDYWELGLLPGVNNQADLDIDMEKHSEAQRNEYREKLFTLARDTLEQAGLSTVKDLKNAFIFSKGTLQEHINKHRISLRS